MVAPYSELASGRRGFEPPPIRRKIYPQLGPKASVVLLRALSHSPTPRSYADGENRFTAIPFQRCKDLNSHTSSDCECDSAWRLIAASHPLGYFSPAHAECPRAEADAARPPRCRPRLAAGRSGCIWDEHFIAEPPAAGTAAPGASRRVRLRRRRVASALGHVSQAEGGTDDPDRGCNPM